MSLYDDIFDTSQEKTEQVADWAKGIKLLQSQLQLKKAAQTVPKREQIRKQNTVLAPVIDLGKQKKEEEESGIPFTQNVNYTGQSRSKANKPVIVNDPDFNVENEYDPQWPNDYETAVREIRERRDRHDKERHREEEEKKRKYKDERDNRDRDKRRGDRHEDDSDRRKSGFSARPDFDEEPITERPKKKGAGAAIAPPPSLQDTSVEVLPPKTSFTGQGYGTGLGGSVAAKIMAKYGFKEGQGLGKAEQGITRALDVEKTSKRGGRIIHEKDVMPPPIEDLSPPPPAPPPAAIMQPKEPPNITEMMKNPSKVVLLKNMVGPGEVDDDLEPEVKDECNNKYGDVIKVIIFELKNVPDDEAVRIFVEFKRIEHAIKAVVDLNGRYFGGRTVQASFYDAEKFQAYKLSEG